jgi:GT2 family glycosyltransferase
MNHQMLEHKPAYALFRATIHGCSIFIPRHLFDDCGLFDVDLPTTQDYDLWSRLIQTTPFVHIPELLVFSRWHDAQGSKQIDHQTEAISFWRRMLDIFPLEEQILLEGSRKQFLLGLAGFLRENGISEVADHAEHLANPQARKPLVSVIIPVYNRFEIALSAIDSVLEQTYQALEIIVVDDGSTGDRTHFESLVVGRDKRIKLINQTNQGPGSARNTGLRAATGEYIAFLDSDDLFRPEKVARQVAAMEEANAVFSHSSYWRWDEQAGLDRIGSGKLISGEVFPEIIGGCPIATPTVMLHRDLIEDGFSFAEDCHIGEDVITWIRVAHKHPILGLDDALSVVRTGPQRAAFHAESQRTGLQYLIPEMSNEPEFAQHEDQISQLRQLLAGISS